MTRDIEDILGDIKKARALVHRREKELLDALARGHDLVAEALGTGLITFADIARCCDEPISTIGQEFRDEANRRKGATGRATVRSRGGARPRPPLKPDPTDTKLVGSAEIARMAGVVRASVSNWKQRHEDFPAPAPVSASQLLYDREEVVTYLRGHGYLPD